MIIILCIAAIVVILITQNLPKPTQTNEDQQYITKGSITTNTSSSELAENYTSIQLLTYCTSSEYQVYNDVCIRGLWDVSDQCKNENFSNINPICNDSRFTGFENKVSKEMQDLNKSLTSFVNSCVKTKFENDTASCTLNIERIKNDCSDPRFYEMMSICKDPNLDLLVKTYSNGSSLQ